MELVVLLAVCAAVLALLVVMFVVWLLRARRRMERDHAGIRLEPPLEDGLPPATSQHPAKTGSGGSLKQKVLGVNNKTGLMPHADRAKLFSTAGTMEMLQCSPLQDRAVDNPLFDHTPDDTVGVPQRLSGNYTTGQPPDTCTDSQHSSAHASNRNSRVGPAQRISAVLTPHPADGSNYVAVSTESDSQSDLGLAPLSLPARGTQAPAAGAHPLHKPLSHISVVESSSDGRSMPPSLQDCSTTSDPALLCNTPQAHPQPQQPETAAAAAPPPPAPPPAAAGVTATTAGATDRSRVGGALHYSSDRAGGHTRAPARLAVRRPGAAQPLYCAARPGCGGAHRVCMQCLPGLSACRRRRPATPQRPVLAGAAVPARRHWAAGNAPAVPRLCVFGGRVRAGGRCRADRTPLHAQTGAR
eukprot:m.188851 g.188851  ORF g.188851 m.188851 type:complete len:413 (+) comp21659_c2_seq2:157-1395(+)